MRQSNSFIQKYAAKHQMLWNSKIFKNLFNHQKAERNSRQTHSKLSNSQFWQLVFIEFTITNNKTKTNSTKTLNWLSHSRRTEPIELLSRSWENLLVAITITGIPIERNKNHINNQNLKNFNYQTKVTLVLATEKISL